MPNERMLTQELQSNKTFLSSLILTFNEFPEWFHETAMEERGMYMDFSSEPPNTEAQANRWREAYNCIPEWIFGAISYRTDEGLDNKHN